MANNNYNHVDPRTGTITYNGPSVTTKGNHNNMPGRTSAYLSTDDRGHIQASSLGGSNKSDNVVPQSSDLNRRGGSYYSMEEGERAALKNGAAIQSEKIAYVNGQPGNRPEALMINDSITYSDGQTQTVHLSFANMTNAEQEALNAESIAQASDMMDAYPNPGDELRASMSPEEYAQLMEETDAALPNISDMYDQHTSTGNAAVDNTAAIGSTAANAQWDFDTAAQADTQTGNAVSADANAQFDFEAGAESDAVSSEAGAVSVEADAVSAEADSADIGGTDDGADPSADDE